MQPPAAGHFLKIAPERELALRFTLRSEVGISARRAILRIEHET
jgi:hypothetical protein